MSKINSQLVRSVQGLATEHEIDIADIEYAGMPILKAIETEKFQVDVILTMQFISFAYGYYVDEYQLFTVGGISNLIAMHCDEVSPAEKNTLQQYYERTFPDKKKLNPASLVFFRFIAIRALLFTGNTPITIEPSFSETVIELDYDLVVLDHLRSNMRSLVTPTKEMLVNKTQEPQQAIETSNNNDIETQHNEPSI